MVQNKAYPVLGPISECRFRKFEARPQKREAVKKFFTAKFNEDILFDIGNQRD